MADFGESLPGRGHKRRLRAVFAADVANFSGMVSVSETRGFSTLSQLLKIGCEELARYEGKLVSMPGDGLFALFESAVDSVHCALSVQERLSNMPDAAGMRLRIGIHLGEVLFEGDVPFGETLNIAARLESLAEPGGILVSAAVVDAVAARVSATFQERGVPRLKNIPRRIPTFSVEPAGSGHPGVPGGFSDEPLDHTMRFSRRLLAAPAPDAPYRAGAPAPRKLHAVPPPERLVAETTPEPVAAAPRPATVAAPAEVEPEVAPAVAARLPPATDPPAARAQAATVPAPTEPAPDAALDISPERLAAITEALSVHLGPVARVLVARRAKAATSIAGLVAALAADIPAETERRDFCSRLSDFSRR